MEIVGRLILRLLLVPLGAAVAICVAMLVVGVAHWNEMAALADASPDRQEAWLFAFVMSGPMLALLLSLTAAFSLMSAAIGVLISETFAIRSWIFHAANGGLAAWIGWSLTQDVRDEYRLLAEPKIMVAAGIAGGLAFWLVAGWTAGFWKPISQQKPHAV
jgi:hypothetical protein